MRPCILGVAALAVVVAGPAAATALPGETGQITFSRDGDVWSADPDGTGEVQLTGGPEDDRWPRWSPEGNRIAVVRDGDLVLLRATGEQLRVLTSHGDVAGAPSWSPDGRYVAYVRGSGGIAVVDATQAGSNGTPLDLGAVTSVAWNPLAADQIAYTGGGAVFTVRPDGSEAGTEIVPPDPDGRTRDELAWDPQSGQVVFTSTGVDGTRIEGAGVSLDGAAGNDRSPAWSADGQRMLFTREDTLHEYRRVPFPGGGNVRSLGLGGASPDAQPSVVSSAAVYETNTDGQLSFRIQPVGAGPTVVAYQTVSGAGSATEGSDYLAAAGEVTTPDPSGDPASIPITIAGDADPEPDETFYVDFTFPSDPAAPLRVRGTILDDDGVPIAVSDVVATPPDTPVDVAVLANDSDPNGHPLSLTAVGVPAHGSVSFVGDVVTYAPGPGFEGIDHFLYTVSGGNGHNATGLVSVYVGVPLPAPPVLTVTPAFLDFGTVPLNKTKDLVLTVTNNTALPVALAETFPVQQAEPQPFDVSDFEGCRSPAARVLEPGQSCTQKVRFWSVPGADAASPATARLLDGATFETLATVALLASVGPPDTGPNLPPVAVDDLAGVAPGFTHTLDAVRNDSDPDDDILRITAVSDPPHGTTAVVPCNVFPKYPNADCVRYVPDDGYLGTDAFTYTVSDGRGGDAAATFHLAVGTVVPQVSVVTPSSGPPAGGQAIRITGSGFVFRSEASFLCPSGQLPLEVSQLTDTEILATTPPAPGGVCAVRVRTLFGQQGQLANAYRYNTAPLAQDGAVLTNEDTPVTITLTATDADGDPLTFAIVTGPGHGALSAVTGAQTTYTPAADYSGPDSFTFRASDGLADSNVATVSITVTPVQAPAVRLLSVTKAGSGGGDVTFAPPGFLGVEALDAGLFHACAIRDGGTVACWGGNFRGETDAPGGTFRSTTAGDLYTCGVRTDSTVACWGTNDNGETTPPTGGGFASASAGGGHTCGLRADGTLTCWGRNNLGQANAPAGVYRAVSAGFEHTCAIRNDRTLACWGRNTQGQATAPVGTFESVAAGDLHTCAVRTDGTAACWGSNGASQAAPPTGTFTSVAAGFLHSCGLRGDGTVVCWGANSSGELNAPAGSFTAVSAGRSYTCATRSSGTLACWGIDNHGQTAAPAGDFVAACPTCRAYPAGTEVALEAIPAADSIFSGWSGDCTGTGACTVTMDQDRSVTATFVAATETPTTTTVTTSGSPSRAGQTVTFTATVASAGAPGPTPAGQVHFEDTTAGTALGTVPLDASGSAALQTSALTIGTHTIQATYLPAPGQIYSGSSGVVIQVVEADIPPVAVDDGPFSVVEGDALTVPPPGVLANDADPEQAALTARFVTAPAHGVLFLRTSGGFDYTPGAGYTGPDSFTYVANDGHADSNVATVSLVVHPRVVVIDLAETVHVTDTTDTTTVDPVMIEVAETIHVSDDITVKTSPRAHDGTAATPEDTPVLVTLSATDPDGDPFTLTIVNGPAHGTVFPPPGTVMPSGTPVTYTPGPNHFGADSFTFKATDGQGDSNVATIVIAVAPVPDPPAAAPDGPYFVNEGGTLTEPAPGVLLNDADADLEPLTARLVTAPAHGTVTLTAAGGFTYAPAPRYVGPDTFTYVANDGLLDSNPATVAIVVRPAPGHEVLTGIVPPGGTLTTETEGDGATPEDVIETAVLTPQGGEVTIDEGPAPPPLPTAFTFLAQEVQITAPPGSPTVPLLLTFLIDDSVVSFAGGTLETLGVFRNGFEVPPCLPGSTATPDPCVSVRQLVDDDVRLAVRTSRASVWTFGVPRSTPGLATGALRPRSGGTVAFAATRIHGQLVGGLTYQKGSEQFLALRVSAFAVEDDGHTAWFAGRGVDGRAFLAYAEDRGASGDIFRLWIGGVEKTGDGRLASGQVVVAP